MLKWDQRGRAYLVQKVQKLKRGETNGRFS